MSKYVVCHSPDKVKCALENSSEQPSKEKEIEFYSPWYSGSKVSCYSR